MNILPRFANFEVGKVGFDDKNEAGQPYDLLGRKETGKQLSELLERIEEPLVIALDGGWGSGKSHFLRLWAGAHKIDFQGKAQVIYFDAFEQDYLDDPLVSLVGAVLRDSESNTAADKFKNLKNSAMKLAKPATRIGLAVMTAGASELVGAVADAGLKAVEEEGTRAINDFWEKENKRASAMKQFRESLEKIASSEDDQGKLIFIIDELDRCRPDYALSLLEIAKHFFSVPNVHFVLGTNLTSLEESVTSRYGSGIDAYQYIRRFIHLRLTLSGAPNDHGKAPWQIYWHHITNGNKTDTYIATGGLLELISRRNYISLRNLERLSLRLKLINPNINNIQTGFTYGILTAAIFESFSKQNYTKLRSMSIVKSDIMDTFDINKAASEGNHQSNVLRISWEKILGEIIAPEDMDYSRQLFNTSSDPARIFQNYLGRYFDTVHLLD